jgi:beta-glucosidase-like glycosyl hydrolase
VIESALREAAARIVIPRLEGDRLADPAYLAACADLVGRGVGGFLLFGGTYPEIADHLLILQRASREGLLIASDLERGLGQQVAGGTRFPCQMALGSALDPQGPEDAALLTQILTILREEARAVGIQLLFTPVLDLHTRPDNPIVGTRAFSDDPQRVAQFALRFADVLQQPDPAGRLAVLATAKHFPGHGETIQDSHLTLPAVEADLVTLERRELIPFRAACEAGIGALMLGHLRVPALEPEAIPVTFSRRVIQGLLREQWGYQGLVVSDALSMGAITAQWREEEAAVLALLAGVDLLLHPSEPMPIVEAVIEAVHRGALDGARVLEAAGRVSAARRRLGLPRPFVRQEMSMGAPEAQAVADRLAARAVRVARGRDRLPFILADQQVVHIVLDDDDQPGVELPFQEALRASAAKMETLRLTPGVTPEGGARALDLARKADRILLSCFGRVAAWKGRAGLHPVLRAFAGQILLTGKPTALICFGSPELVRGLEAPLSLLAYDDLPAAQRAAAAILTGVPA